MKLTAYRAGWLIATCGTAFAMPAILSRLLSIGLLFGWSAPSFGAGAEGFAASETFLLEVFKAVLVALATWAALKVEIAAARIMANAAKQSADEAHKRIDIHLEAERRRGSDAH